jgi:chromosome segregation protein
VLGPLIDHVRSTPGCERLAEILVGDVFVARDLDAAMALADRRPDLRFVTLGGDLADAAGLLAGSGALTQGAVGRRSSAADLAQDLERITTRLTAIESEREDLARRQAELQERRERAGTLLEEALAARSQAESRLATARARHEDVDLDLTALQSESEGATTEVAELEADLASETARRDQARAAHAAAGSALADLERGVAESEAAREEAAQRAAEARILAARARERLEGLSRRRTDLAAVVAENREELERARRLANEHPLAQSVGLDLSKYGTGQRFDFESDGFELSRGAAEMGRTLL